MHTIGVVGPGATAAADRLVAALDGRVALVRDASARTDGEAADGGVQRARPATEYELGAEWRAYGESLTLRETFDRLAPDHDHAVAVGFPEARIPQVALGDATAEDVLVAAPDAESFDPSDAASALADREPHVTLESLVASVKESDSADRAGAVATFTGRVRARDDPDDERTEFLEFEAYDGVAREKMAAIAADLEAREGVFEVAMHHRTGVVSAGEDIVFVVALAGHRAEAFRAVEDGIDRLKDEVPLFKKEVTETDEFWVHERE